MFMNVSIFMNQSLGEYYSKTQFKLKQLFGATATFKFNCKNYMFM